MKQYGNGKGSEGIPFRAFRRFPGDSHCSRAAGTVPDTQTRRRPLTPAPSSEQMEWTQALRCSNEPLVCSGRAVLCLTHLPWLNHNMLSYNLPPTNRSSAKVPPTALPWPLSHLTISSSSPSASLCWGTGRQRRSCTPDEATHRQGAYRSGAPPPSPPPSPTRSIVTHFTTTTRPALATHHHQQHPLHPYSTVTTVTSLATTWKQLRQVTVIIHTRGHLHQQHGGDISRTAGIIILLCLPLLMFSHAT